MFCIYCRHQFDEKTETICASCGRELYKTDTSVSSLSGLSHGCFHCGTEFPVNCANCGSSVSGPDGIVPPEGWIACGSCQQSFWVICPECQRTQEKSPEEQLPELEPLPELPQELELLPGQNLSQMLSLTHNCTHCGVAFPVNCTSCGQPASDPAVPPEGWLYCAPCNQSYWVICPYCQQMQQQEQQSQMQQQEQQPQTTEQAGEQPGQITYGSFANVSGGTPTYIDTRGNPAPLGGQSYSQQQWATPQTPSGITGGPGGISTGTGGNQQKPPRKNKPRIKPAYIAPLLLIPAAIVIIWLRPWEEGWRPTTDWEHDYGNNNNRTAQSDPSACECQYSLLGEAVCICEVCECDKDTPPPKQNTPAELNYAKPPTAHARDNSTIVNSSKDFTYIYWHKYIAILDNNTGEEIERIDISGYLPDQMEHGRTSFLIGDYIYFMTNARGYGYIGRYDIKNREIIVYEDIRVITMRYDGEHIYAFSLKGDSMIDYQLHKIDPMNYTVLQTHDILDSSFSMNDNMVWNGKFYYTTRVVYDDDYQTGDASDVYKVLDLETGTTSRFLADKTMTADYLCASQSYLFYIRKENYSSPGVVYSYHDNEHHVFFDYNHLSQYYEKDVPYEQNPDFSYDSGKFYYLGTEEIYLDGDWLYAKIFVGYVNKFEHEDYTHHYLRFKTDGSNVIQRINFPGTDFGSMPFHSFAVSDGWIADGSYWWQFKDDRLVMEGSKLLDSPIPFDNIK